MTQLCEICTGFGLDRCGWPSNPRPGCARGTIRARGSDRHPWRPVDRQRPKLHKLSGTPRSCTAEIKYMLSPAEFARPQMRLAVHDEARATGWNPAEFRENLIDELRDANVFFTDVTGQIFDLPLEALNDERDGFEFDADLEGRAVAEWIETSLLAPRTLNILPDHYGIGKARFICVASALIAIRPALEARLSALADAENRSFDAENPLPDG